MAMGCISVTLKKFAALPACQTCRFETALYYNLPKKQPDWRSPEWPAIRSRATWPAAEGWRGRGCDIVAHSGPNVDRLQFRSATGRLLGHGNPPINDEQEGLGYANRHLPNRDRRQGDVTTLKFACTHGPCFLTGTVPPIIDRPLPSQPQRIAQGCFYPAQGRQALDSFS